MGRGGVGLHRTHPFPRLLPPLPAEIASRKKQREPPDGGFSSFTTDRYSSLVGGTFVVIMQTMTEAIHIKYTYYK